MGFMFDFCSFILGGLLFWLLGWLLDWLFSGQKHSQQQALVADLERKISSGNTELERTKLQFAERNSLFGKLETEASELKVRLPKLEGFERANADLRLQLQGFDTVKAKLTTAESELASLRVKAADFDALQGRFDGLQTELSGLKTKTTGFEAIQARASLATDLEAKVAALEAEKVAQLKEVNVAVLKASDAEAAQLKLKASLAESVAEVARTRAGMQQFEGLKARIDELEARGVSNETQAKLDSLETELAAYKSRVSQLEMAGNTELDGAKRRISELEIQLTEARSHVGAHTELETLQAKYAALEAEHHAKNTELLGFTSLAAGVGGLAGLQAKLGTDHSAELTALRSQITERDAEISQLRSRSVAKADNLEDINGIGAVIARKLEAAGMTTFAQLAQSNPEALNTLVQPKEFQKYDYIAWIEDAAFFARGEKPPTRERVIEAKLSRIEGIGDVAETKLEAAGINTYAELAAASDEVILVALGRNVDSEELELWRAEAIALRDGTNVADAREATRKAQLERREAEMKRLQSELKEAESLRRDRFDLITGLGDAAMRKLYGAGIYVYEELAQMSPLAIGAVLENEDLNFEQIKLEAAAFAKGENVVTPKDGE